MLQFVSVGWAGTGVGLLLLDRGFGLVLVAIGAAFMLMAWLVSKAEPCDDAAGWHETLPCKIKYLYPGCPDMPESVCIHCPLWDGLQCTGEE